MSKKVLNIKLGEVTIGSEGAKLQVIPASGFSFNSGGYKIILKDAKIVAKRLIIRRIEPEKT